MELAPWTVDELQSAAGFGFEDGFHDQLPTAIQDGDHDRFLVHVHADILDVATHFSCLLWGKGHSSPTLIFPPRGKVPFSSRFAYALLHFFPPHTPLQLLSSRRSGAEPCTAQRSGGGATSSFDLLKRALFHNALTWVGQF